MSRNDIFSYIFNTLADSTNTYPYYVLYIMCNWHMLSMYTITEKLTLK